MIGLHRARHPFDNPPDMAVESARMRQYRSPASPAEAERMHITVKLFALMREHVGTDTIDLALSDGVDIGQALAALRHQYPALEPYLDNVRLSLHMEFVEAETILHAGDELALIPPVSGGT